MTALPSAHRDLLIRMLQAERHQQRGGQRQSFVLCRAASAAEMLTAGWDPSWAIPGEQDIDDLAEAGLLRLSEPARGRGRKFDLTLAGRTRARQLERRRTDGKPSEPVDLSWPATLTLADTIVEAYERRRSDGAGHESANHRGGAARTGAPRPRRSRRPRHWARHD